MHVVSPYVLGEPHTVPRGGAATIGVFDGVHCGHRAILDRVRQRAKDCGGPASVVTFSVHPKTIVQGKAPKQITSVPHRLRILESLGIDVVLVIPFDAQTRNTEASTFVQTVFCETLGIEHLVLGHDSAFGKDRRGDAAFLRKHNATYGVSVEVVSEVRAAGELVSSSRIRELILEGELQKARDMLGQPVSMLGTVVRGDQRGRTLGFPTANLRLQAHEAYPKYGVYAVRVAIDGEEPSRLGVCNIGHRPTFDHDAEALTEVHLLDFDGDLYGRDLLVEFVHRLRDEGRFERVEDLRQQILLDIETAREKLHAEG